MQGINIAIFSHTYRPNVRNKYQIGIKTILLFSILFCACNPSKRLYEDEYLLTKNKIIVEDHEHVNSEELYGILKQKPNRKILGLFRFHLHAYNLPDPRKMYGRSRARGEKIKAKNEKRKVRYERKNKKRKEKGKPEKEFVPTPYSYTWSEWLKLVVGEEPELLDSSKVLRSVEQMHLRLEHTGFFNNTVHDSIVLDSAKKRAKVYYIVKARQPYKIGDIKFQASDPRMLKYLKYASKKGKNNREGSVLHSGHIYNIDVLSKERKHIESYLQNRGYHFFTKDYVYYLANKNDSTHIIDLTLGISNVQKRDEFFPDSTFELNHEKFIMNNIYINTDYDVKLGKEIEDYDSTHFQEFIFLYQESLRFHKELLLESVFLRKGNYYRLKEVESTYQKLTSLGVFKTVNIVFKLNPEDPSQTSLDCFIYLSPVKTQSYSLESDGTNKGGNFGISAKALYKHKNTFKGAEVFKISLHAGLEIQQLLIEENDESSGLNPLRTFNTLEFGPDASLFLPRFVGIKPLSRLLPGLGAYIGKHTNPKSGISIAYNYQTRPDFTRTVQDFTFSYDLRPSSFVHVKWAPLQLSSININKSQAFQDRLDSLNTPILAASYQNHIIPEGHISYTYNAQSVSKHKSAFYIHVNFESAGNLLRGVYNLANAPLDSNNSYNISGIRFAQYIKAYTDLRYYTYINDKSSLVSRLAFGFGAPGKNLSQALPFEKSFFAGGANTLRAWQSRTIGPGTFFDPSVSFDKIGDVLLEGNIEYRFNLLDALEAAFFIDAANIWLWNDDPARPGSQFRGKNPITELIPELGIGAGVGIRFDLDFFVIRVDVGAQLKDPSLQEGERWFNQPKDNYNQAVSDYINTGNSNNAKRYPYKLPINFNLGIGYPF
jgi:outer membrane protein assembly factor BamA